MVGFVFSSGPAGSRIVIGGEGFIGVARFIHGFGLRILGTPIPQDQGWADFRPKKTWKIEKISGKRLQEARRFLFQLGRAAWMVECDDLQQCRPKFFPGKSIGFVKNCRISGPEEGDLPDRQVFLEPQPQQFHSPDGVGPGLVVGIASQSERRRHGIDSLRHLKYTFAEHRDGIIGDCRILRVFAAGRGRHALLQ